MHPDGRFLNTGWQLWEIESLEPLRLASQGRELRDPNRVDIERLSPGFDSEPEITGGYTLLAREEGGTTQDDVAVRSWYAHWSRMTGLDPANPIV